MLKKKTTTVAFVIGNGTSRKTINIDKLKEFGKTYGCNAIYRDCDVDYLIAVDKDMVDEIVQAKFHLTGKVWSNENNHLTRYEKINYFNPSLGWSSGPTALHLASIHKPTEIYILGFDYAGVGENQSLVNNIYAGTPNYKKINERATYYGNWERQTFNIINSNQKIKYFRVIETQGSFTPELLKKLPNLLNITLDDFERKFN